MPAASLPFAPARTAKPSRPDTRSRKERADETRSRIFTAAVQLFAEEGYATVSVDRIATRAGIAKGTFFVHFRSKDAVVTELVRIQTTAARSARKRALEAGKGPVAAVRAAVLALGKQAARSRDLSRSVLAATLMSPQAGKDAASLFQQVFAEMADDVADAGREGRLADRVDAKTLAASLMTAYLGSVLHFASSPDALSLVALLERLVDDTLARALRQPSDGRRPPNAPALAPRKRRK